jgi:pimeloyl-ACP methyl ester carboxylesterase
MPLNLAVFAPMRAADVIAARPGIERWAIGGHSLGGAMAARFVRDEPELADALFLWAAYPAASDDLSTLPFPMASVYGTLDGVAIPEQVLAAEPRLAPDTRWIPIAGGNHAQFGSYGPQRGDRRATVSRETQQAEAVNATAGLLEPIR